MTAAPSLHVARESVEPPVAVAPALSIVIVSWNTRQLLFDCLKSIFDNAAIPIEVFVVDNASTDDSAEMVEEAFPRVMLIRNSENRGFATANNQALAAARGRYVLLLNSDTQILGDVLRRTVEFMDEHLRVGVMGCRVLNPDRSVQLTCFQTPSLLNLVLLISGLARLPWPRFFGRHQMLHWRRDDERDVQVVTGCYMAVRREALEQVGPLDERFFFCGEETDWCRRFRDAGWQVRFAPVGEIIHHGNASGSRHGYRRDLMLTKGILQYHRKHNGLLATALAWLLLLIFHVTRMFAWSAAYVITRRPAARERTRHFFSLTLQFHRTWP